MTKALRKTMISTICMLVVAVLSLTGVTYAWFSMGTTGSVTGIEMSVSAAEGGLQLSENGTSDWKANLVLTGATKSSMMPVSTVDAKDFYTATVNPDNPDQIKTAKDEANANVWVKSFYAKNTGYNTVVVTLGGDVFTDEDTNDTKDSSAAARIAVFTKLQGAEDYTLAYIWGEGDSNTGVSGASDAFFNYRGSNVSNIIGAVSGLKTSIGDCTFELPGLKVTGEGETAVATEQIVEIRVVVWVEGQDTECINQNAASKFKVALNFNSAVKPE